MNNKSLYFELLSIVLLLCIGSFLILQGLPGWGLISMAAILATCSLVLRQLNKHQAVAANAATA